MGGSMCTVKLILMAFVLFDSNSHVAGQQTGISWHLFAAILCHHCGRSYLEISWSQVAWWHHKSRFDPVCLAQGFSGFCWYALIHGFGCMVFPGHSGMLESWQSKVAASAVLVGFACARASFARQVESNLHQSSHESHIKYVCCCMVLMHVI